MRAIAIPALVAGLLLGSGAAGEEEVLPWCGVVDSDVEQGPMAMWSAQSLEDAGFEDEVDLSGRTAVIDILFLYTERAERYWAEAPAKWPPRVRLWYGTNLREAVEREVDRASLAMLDSGTNARLRLVGLEPGPEFLDRLDPAEGGLLRRALGWAELSPEAGQLRDRYGADLVYVLTGPIWSPCGVAVLPSSLGRLATASVGALAFSRNCVARGVYLGGGLLAHEVGHNLGLVHDRFTEAAGFPFEPLRPGGRGYAGTDRFGKRYGTVMSVSRPVDLYTPRYSTSSANADGRIIGLSGEHEAADAFRFAAPYAAAIRRSKHVEDGGRYGCFEDGWSDCVGEGRFKVEAEYGTSGGELAPALIREAHLGDSGTLFYFYSWDNPELLVKVLDGCGVNGHHWVFGSAATDREYVVRVEDLRNGTRQEYRRGRSDPLIAEVTAFPCGPGQVSFGSGASSPTGTADWFGGPETATGVQLALDAVAAVGPSDVEDGGGWGCYSAWFGDCMVDGRFGATVHYWLPHEEWADEDEKREARKTANVRPAALGDNAALFYFFSFDNPELLIKVIDGCAINGHYWVFGSAASDLEHRVYVRDLPDCDPVTNSDYCNINPGSQAVGKGYERDGSNPLIADTTAFRCELD